MDTISVVTRRADIFPALASFGHRGRIATSTDPASATMAIGNLR
jgi:hypothetical protein